MSWSELGGIPAGFADGVGNNSGGDITGVTAGLGLSGGGTSGTVALNVAFAGDGIVSKAARSDHDHRGGQWRGDDLGLSLDSGHTQVNFAGDNAVAVRYTDFFGVLVLTAKNDGVRVVSESFDPDKTPSLKGQNFRRIILFHLWFLP